MFQQETKNILPENSGTAHNKQYGVFGKKSLSRSQSGYSKLNFKNTLLKIKYY
jgi:hypothetical protein